jgi:hypothetical protein
MSSYGTVVIQDGVYEPAIQDPSLRRAPVRMAGEAAPLPPRIVQKPGLVNFVVELHYKSYRNIYSGGAAVPLGLTVEYAKKFTRVASDRNPVSDIKKFVSNFASCDEASKLRKRIIAISRIHKSISNETFRFGVVEE